MNPALRHPLTTARVVHHAFGFKGLARRAMHVAAVCSGMLTKATPMATSFDDARPAPWTFRFDIDALRDGYRSLDGPPAALTQNILAQAERTLRGELWMYGWTWKETSWPPKWDTNPFTGHQYQPCHWTRISDNDPEVGDIKDVWELSRLPFTYLFARAWVLTEEDRWPEAWWSALEDWTENNPPNTGVNWKCGQESSLRAIAVQFGMAIFASHPASTADRMMLASRLLGATAARVRPTVSYALSQRNNHAISELVFLLTLAPDDRKLASLLSEVVADQFYEDGSYAQQSFIYQRLALHALAWLLVTTPTLPPDLRLQIVQALADSRVFLERCTDPVSGHAPNYGPNDGALLFPLDHVEHGNFRPLLSMLGEQTEATFETALWMPLPDVAATSSEAGKAASTYVTIRDSTRFLLMRVGLGRHRAAHADQGAVELWIDGEPVAIDPGTYRYTAPAPWGNPLAGPAAHNAPWAGGDVVNVGRFLAAPQATAQLIADTQADGQRHVVVEIPLGSAVVVRRTVTWSAHVIEVRDDVSGGTANIHWCLAPAQAHRAAIRTSGEICRVEPTRTNPVGGWSSSHYAKRQPTSSSRVLVGPRGWSAAAFTSTPHA